MFDCNIHGMATAQHDLIEAKLPTGETLRAFVAKRRRRGAGWRSIANELSDTTGVYTSHTTLRRWFGASEPRVVSTINKAVSA